MTNEKYLEDILQNYLLEGMENYAVWCLRTVLDADDESITNDSYLKVAIDWRYGDRDIDHLRECLLHDIGCDVEDLSDADKVVYYALHVIGDACGVSEADGVFEDIEALNFNMAKWLDNNNVEDDYVG